MLREKLQTFIDKQVYDFGNFTYSFEEDEEYIHVIFTTIFANDSDTELTFKLIGETLYLHTTTFGWKPIEKGSANKYFWIELLINE